MKNLLLRLSCGFGISVLLLMITPTAFLDADTLDHPMKLDCLMYEFDKKSELIRQNQAIQICMSRKRF